MCEISGKKNEIWHVSGAKNWNAYVWSAPKSLATQSYGQSPAGTLTIGFEEQVKVWLGRYGRRCNDSTTWKSGTFIPGVHPTHLQVRLPDWTPPFAIHLQVFQWQLQIFSTPHPALKCWKKPWAGAQHPWTLCYFKHMIKAPQGSWPYVLRNRTWLTDEGFWNKRLVTHRTISLKMNFLQKKNWPELPLRSGL